MRTELERAAAFEERLREAAAERVVPTPLGSAVFNDTLPRVWSLNVLRIETDASAEAVVEEAERLQSEAGLSHRRVLFTTEVAGREVEDAFAGMGWKTDAFVFMVRRKEPARAVDTSPVTEVEAADLLHLHDRIAREAMVDADEETISQIAEANRLVAEAANARHFAMVVDGVAVSSADLYSDGQTAQIEDVMTLPEYRGHGYASAVVIRGVEEALQGHDFVFLTADARDWPKELYRRLGFESLGEKYAYLRSPVETR
jgi:predicted GNAT family acetyltransferase